MRIEGHCGLHPCVLDRTDGAVQVRADFVVDVHRVDLQSCQLADELHRLYDHQMHIQRLLDDGADGLKDGEPEGNIGHEDAIHDVNDLKGKVAAATLNKGAVLQTSMLQDPPQLTEGYREVSIMIDAETGVAGKVTPGSRVDIVSTVEDPNTKAQKSEIIIQNALITEVGVTTKVQDKDENGNFSEEKDSVPVTFSLTPEQSLKLAYAESFSKKVRLLLRRDGDQGTAQTPEYSANPGTPAQGAN